ncbi:MAG: hypothetical protein M0T84_13520 [Betaproteobacteria bacterium]|nr:hypothetical protein [Betaproteobacteria bacterium]
MDKFELLHDLEADPVQRIRMETAEAWEDAQRAKLRALAERFSVTLDEAAEYQRLAIVAQERKMRASARIEQYIRTVAPGAEIDSVLLKDIVGLVADAAAAQAMQIMLTGVL